MYQEMNWDKRQIKKMPMSHRLIMAGDDRIERYSEDTMMHGSPDAVLVARDAKEVAEALAYCDAARIPVTICGAQTSMTGASVPLEGLLISTEKLQGVVDISDGREGPLATVLPGTVVADFQKAVADAGFFYPVAPTSRDECTIGANIATNATGEDSYKYGPLRPYLKALQLVLPSGKTIDLKRRENEKPSFEINKGGYLSSWKNPIDLVIGSEGTIGFVSSATFTLLPHSRDFFSALIPFASNMDALRFIVETATRKNALNLRTLEYVDGNAMQIMKTAEGFPKISDDVGAMVYAKQEFEDAGEKEFWLTKWHEVISRCAGVRYADGILIASTRAEQENFRIWRHKIPETENETGRKFWADGGGKVGSDWWVPIGRLLEMMKFFYAVADSAGLPYIAYAHLGMGHPHTNFHSRNEREKKIAKEALRACCEKAVLLGGGVCGEHGLGKIHADLLSVQYSGSIIDQMKAWKKEYDPNWILGRGNIFEIGR